MKQLIGLTLLSALATTPSSAEESANPRVVFETTKGNIVIELYADKAPKSVANFLSYVDDGFYDGTVFHRVIKGFMVQGGGFTADMKKKGTKPPIENEADNGVSNARGTLAMARTNDPHSATAQFFINSVDNDRLDHTSKDARGWGYAVFGGVVEGMEVVDAISDTKTTRKGMMGDVPVDTITLVKAKRQN